MQSLEERTLTELSYQGTDLSFRGSFQLCLLVSGSLVVRKVLVRLGFLAQGLCGRNQGVEV